MSTWPKTSKSHGTLVLAKYRASVQRNVYFELKITKNLVYEESKQESEIIISVYFIKCLMFQETTYKSRFFLTIKIYEMNKITNWRSFIFVSCLSSSIIQNCKLNKYRQFVKS